MSAAQAQQKICSEWNPVNKSEHKAFGYTLSTSMV